MFSLNFVHSVGYQNTHTQMKSDMYVLRVFFILELFSMAGNHFINSKKTAAKYCVCIVYIILQIIIVKCCMAFFSIIFRSNVRKNINHIFKRNGVLQHLHFTQCINKCARYKDKKLCEVFFFQDFFFFY